MKEETARRKRESGVVGGTKWKKSWQAGCSMAGKWDSHTAVFWRRGTPEIGVTLFHCQGEERERNTRDVVMYRDRRRRIGVRQKSKTRDRPWSSCCCIT